MSTKVVLLSNLPVAGAVWQQYWCLKKYTNLDIRYICHKSRYNDGRIFPHDLLFSQEEAKDVLREADVIHIHNDFRDARNFLDRKRKKIIGTLHSVPCPTSWYAVRSIAHEVYCVRQPMQQREYPTLSSLPNLFDIWEWIPKERIGEKLRVVYCPSTQTPSLSPFGKGYSRVYPILQKLQNQGLIDLIHFSGIPYLENLKRKADGHLVIDDVIASHNTFHLTSLEGGAFGQVVLTSFSPKKKDYPFHTTILETLEEVIRSYIQVFPNLTIGQETRLWMEKNWNPKSQTEEFLAIYTS